MPVERQAWANVSTFPALNARMARVCDVIDGNDRYVTQTADATKALALASPLTLVESTTTAGAVTLTLPSAAAHVGYRVDVYKVTGANALTVNGTTVTTARTCISNGATWRVW